MDDYIETYILHYSDVHDKEVSKMIISKIVPSEADAKRLISFIDVLYKCSRQDMEEGKIVLGEPADDYDAEKATIIILGLLRSNNFNTMVDNWY